MHNGGLWRQSIPVVGYSGYEDIRGWLMGVEIIGCFVELPLIYQSPQFTVGTNFRRNANAV